MKRTEVLGVNGKKSSSRCFYLFAFIFLFPANIFAQYYNSDAQPFDVSFGLPNNEINEIIKDDEGYVWIATDGGLSRYDGYNFINFNATTHPEIFKNNRIVQIRKHGALLYLLTEADGLIELNPKKISFRKVYSSNPRALAFSHDTTVILFDTGNLLFKVKNKVVFKRHFHVHKQSSVVIHQGKIFFSLNSDQLFLINPNLPQKNREIFLDSTDEAGSLLLSKKYGVVSWNGDVVRMFKDNSLVYHPDFINKKGISYFTEESSGKNMVIDRYRTPIVNFDDVNVTLKLGWHKNLQFKSICRVNVHCFLIATNQGVVRVYRVPSLNRRVLENIALNEDQVLVRRKIVEYQNKRFHLGYPFVFEEKEQTVKYLTSKVISTYDGVVLNDELFCTTEGNGLLSVDENSGKLTQHICSAFGTQEYFESICLAPNGQLLLAGFNKVATYNPSSKKGYAQYLEKELIIHVVVPSNDPNVFYLGTNKGLRQVRVNTNGTLEKIETKCAEPFDVRDILVQPDQNRMWLATLTGVVVMDAKSLKIVRHYSGEKEVSNPKVVRLLQDKHKKIWAATYSGFTVFNAKSGKIFFVNKNHGVINTEFNYKSGCALSNGNLIFGGLNAFEEINPDVLNQFAYAKSFEISGTEIIQNDKGKRFSNHRKGDAIEFNTGKEAVKIYLANRDYTFGVGYTFKYSLDSKTWFKVDQKNCILLSNLAYGDYILNIRMFNPFGQLVEEKSIKVFALVPFYAKSSFLWLIISLLVAMTMLTILYFLRSIRVKAETKSKIAMDLHDESGTILTRLLILVNREKFEDHEKDVLKSGLKEALYSFRTYLDSISKTKCSWLELSDELNEFVSKSCRNAAIEPKIEMQSDIEYQLKGELARDIKLVVYEIVTNSIKHANAKQLSLHCTLKNNQFRMTISDSGKCDLSELEVFKGNGIRNLKKRISRNNGRLMYYIPKGETGLTVEVFLPL